MHTCIFLQLCFELVVGLDLLGDLDSLDLCGGLAFCKFESDDRELSEICPALQDIFPVDLERKRKRQEKYFLRNCSVVNWM